MLHTTFSTHRHPIGLKQYLKYHATIRAGPYGIWGGPKMEDLGPGGYLLDLVNSVLSSKRSYSDMSSPKYANLDDDNAMPQ
jgi:hypothetical protein